MHKLQVLTKAIATIQNWPAYLADYAKVKQGDLTYVLRDGSRYVVRAGSNDRNIFNEIVIHQLYTRDGFDIHPGDIIMDIGAHIGLFSVFASQRALQVYALEPVPENFAMLEKNIEVGKRTNITAINKAVAATTGSRELFFDESNKGGHSFFSSIEKQKEKQMVIETISFADLWQEQNIERIDFLKLDCEGGEYEILFTCPLDLLSKIKKVSMEYHPIDQERNEKTLKKFFEEHGFSVRLVPEQSMLYATRA